MATPRMDLITVQETFEEVIQDIKVGNVNEDKFWIAKRPLNPDDNQELYAINLDTKHGIINNETIKFLPHMRRKYRLVINNNEYNLLSFKQKLPIVNKFEKITSVSSNNEILIIGTSKGTIIVYDLLFNKIENQIDNAHDSDVIQVKLFPSNKVIISVGLDLRIKIWSIDSKTPTRIMSDQVSEITDLKLIGLKGRNFLTSSKDGSVNLWECGSGGVIHKFRRIDNYEDSVNCFTIGTIEFEGDKLSNLEFETEGKCLYAGYESGLIQQFNIADHSQTRKSFGIKDNNSVESIEIVKDYLIGGYSNGDLKIWDINDQSLKYIIAFNSNFPISIIKVLKYNDVLELLTILIYNGPETLLKVTISLNSLQIDKIEYLIGLPELFQINSIDKNNETIVIGGNDGLIALYDI